MDTRDDITPHVVSYLEGILAGVRVLSRIPSEERHCYETLSLFVAM